MLTEAEYVQQQISLGRRIHQHDGVWWERIYPFYCKPAFVYRAFDPGSARPSWRRSLLGYSHQVVTPGTGNRSVAFMELGGDDLRQFSLLAVKKVKRNQIRKGLKCCEVAPIGDLERELEGIREINISQSNRQAERFGAETPISRYVDEAEKWRKQVRREAALPGREWWGAFVAGALVAYMTTYQIADVRIIEKVKSHSDHLACCPVDALYFTVLEAAAGDPGCLRVVCGVPQHPSLNHFKEQFLFRARDYPYYSSSARLIEWGKRIALREARARSSH
jgi:hypothetical protein